MTGYRVPDSIEPIEGFRCWNIVDGNLVSITNGEVWTPGEPLAAKCIEGMGAGYRWVFGRDGMTREKAYERAHPQVDVSGFGGTARQYLAGSWGWGQTPIPSPPAVEPPDGYGFLLERISHDAPAEGCACGIYAVDAEDRVPGNGEVYGKVKLWGKVVPGEKGHRAEFAYPAEFWVPSEMEPNDCLLAFDVPIIIKDDLPKHDVGKNVSVYFNGTNLSNYVTSWDFGPAGKTEPGLRRAKRVMWGAVAVNLGCAAFNLLAAFHVV